MRVGVAINDTYVCTHLSFVHLQIAFFRILLLTARMTDIRNNWLDD